MKTQVLSGCLLQFAAIVGCTDPETAATANYTVTAPEQYCAAFEAAYCANAVLCGRSATRADCAPIAAELRAGCEANFARETAPKLSGDIIAMDLAATSQCLKDFATDCGTDFFVCGQAIFQGLRAIGETCDNDEDCDTDGFCQRDAGSCPGTCVAKAQAGDACKSVLFGSHCAPGLECAQGTCTQGVALGQACGPAPCVGDSFCFEGTCTNTAEVVAACPVDDPTCFMSGWSCETEGSYELHCAITYGVYGGAGATCDPENNFDSATPNLRRFCKFGFACDVDTSTCTRLKPVGAACAPRDHRPFCADGSYCDAATATCTIEPQEGEACTGTCANDRVCTKGVCRAPGAAGAPCDRNSECESRECVDDVCAGECLVSGPAEP